MLAIANVQAIEIFWTLIAVGGAILAAYNTVRAFSDLKALKKLGVLNGRTRIAKSTRLFEICRLTIQLIEVYLGLIAMTLPAGDLSQLPLDVQIKSYSIQYGFVACAILTLLQSVNSFMLRRYFVRRQNGKEVR